MIFFNDPDAVPASPPCCGDTEASVSCERTAHPPEYDEGSTAFMDWFYASRMALRPGPGARGPCETDGTDEAYQALLRQQTAPRVVQKGGVPPNVRRRLKRAQNGSAPSASKRARNGPWTDVPLTRQRVKVMLPGGRIEDLL